MNTEEIIEATELVIILGIIAFIVYEVVGFLKQSGATDAVPKLLAPVTTGLDTLIGPNGEAGVPGTNSNLFYTGINNAIDWVTGGGN